MQDRYVKPPLSQERKGSFTTVSEIPVEAVYTPAHLHREEGRHGLELPGVYPFLRGVHATGYRGRLWTMRMF
ncbi:MAG: methylmalonyl-CoA mutase family protein, partial [SAR202 cluster bacterium]|nr:methylmalonyl-CoA mutase family protein [SAR202 cluster bacterium]